MTAAQKDDARRYAEQMRGRLPARAQGEPRPRPPLGVAGVIALVLCIAALLMAVLALPYALLVQPLMDTDDDATVGSGTRTWIVAVAAAFLLLALVPARRRWALERTPTIPIGSALEGRCEVVGTVEAIEPTTSWFTGQPCVWWQATLYVGHGKRQRKVWEAEEGGERCTLVGDGSRIDVQLDGPKVWRRELTRIQGNPHGAEQGLVEGDRLLVLGDIEFVEGERVLVARRATVQTEGEARKSLRAAQRFFVVCAAVCAAWLAAVTPDDDELVFRPSPALWTLVGAAAVLAAAFLVGLIGDRRANRGFDLGSPVS